MAGMQGWAALGETLAGRVGAPGAYEDGMMQGHKLELAMQQARRERANALIDTVRADNYQQLPTMGQELGISDADARLMAAGGGNAQQLMAARGTALGDGYRAAAAEAATRRYGPDNPNAPLFGLADGPVALGDITDGMAIGDRFADGGGGMTVTPLGEATIRQRNASAASSYATANNANVRSSIAQGQHRAQMSGTWNPGGRAAGANPESRAALADQYGLEGEARRHYALTGQIPAKLAGGSSNSAWRAVENSSVGLERLASEAKAIMDDPALNRITGVQGRFPNYPGGGAADVQARLETLKSQVGFSVLQAMRDASKTGGALGNVSNFEVQALQNNLSALDTSQSPEAFRASLQRIIDYAQDSKSRIVGGYQDTYGEPPVARGLGDQLSGPQAPRIRGAADYNALPSGATYIDPNGQQRRKP